MLSYLTPSSSGLCSTSSDEGNKYEDDNISIFNSFQHKSLIPFVYTQHHTPTHSYGFNLNFYDDMSSSFNGKY